MDGYELAGRVSTAPAGEWDSDTQYSRLDIVTWNNKSYVALQSSIGKEPIGDSTDNYWTLLISPILDEMIGATSDDNGEEGVVPIPSAGDTDKVLTADGTWTRTMQTDIINDDEVYGYMDANDNFMPFISYDEVIDNCMVGDAEPSDVLIGRTFSNASERGLAGTMKDYKESRLIVTTNITEEDSPYLSSVTYDNQKYYEVNMPTGYWEREPEASGALIPTEEISVNPGETEQVITPSNGAVLTKVIVGATNAPTQTKTVTASTSAITVKPDNKYLLSSVTVDPTPSQTKTITASRSEQTVTPDSGKLLNKVVVNKYPDANGTYICGSNNGAAVNNDMGAANNYRYVNCEAVYLLGLNTGKNTNFTYITSVNSVVSISTVNSKRRIASTKPAFVVAYFRDTDRFGEMGGSGTATKVNSFSIYTGSSGGWYICSAFQFSANQYWDVSTSYNLNLYFAVYIA